MSKKLLVNKKFMPSDRLKAQYVIGDLEDFPLFNSGEGNIWPNYGDYVYSGEVSNYYAYNNTFMVKLYSDQEFNYIGFHLHDVRRVDYLKITNNVTSMRMMFCSCYSLTSVGNISNWDTSSVTDMSDMFNGCHLLTSLDLSGWDVSNVTDMSSMLFAKSVNLSNWVISRTTNMDGAFKCGSINASNWTFIEPRRLKCIFNSSNSKTTSINAPNWDTSNITDMSYTFSYCIALTSLDVSNWDTSNVTNMEYMFEVCKLTSLDLSTWDVSKVTNMKYMFRGCSELTSLDLSGWDVSNVTDMSGMFYNCNSLNYINLFNTKGLTTSFFNALPNRTNKESGTLVMTTNSWNDDLLSILSSKNWTIQYA